MTNQTAETSKVGQRNWPPGVTRVPYWVFQDEAVYQMEQQRLFRGESWNYLCLETELAEAGDFRTSYVGETHVIITRDMDGEIYAFENRCAHRGALLTYEVSGKTKNFSCVYHGWGHSLQGDLDSVAFMDGLNGSGGMRPSFCKHKFGPKKMRVAVVHGLVFGSFSNDVPSIEEYLGEEILERIARVLAGRKMVVIGRYTQNIPNNWKLYAENTKDSYHASILHLFFTTFEINRLTQKGGLIINDTGANHVSYSITEKDAVEDTTYSDQEIRSQSDFKLKDPSMLESFDEFGDDITLQILTVFPGFVLQQIFNSVVVRQIVPCGVDKMELHWTYLGFEGDTPEQTKIRLKQANLVGPAGFISMEDGCVGNFVQRGIKGASQEFAVLEMGGDSVESSSSRVTEAAVRGFWKAYREITEL